MTQLELTPRDKAIIVGLFMSGATDIYDLIPPLGELENTITLHWLQNWYNTVQQCSDLADFTNKAANVFLGGKHKWVNRYPAEYVDKMSPLAVAIWLASRSESDVTRSWTAPNRRHFAKRFMSKWSILLNENDLTPRDGADAINLWVMTKKYLQEFAPQLTPHFVAMYPRNGKLIYLSGGQQYSKDGGASWRAEVTPILYRAGYDVFNPVYEGSKVHDRFGVNFDQLDLEDYMKAGSIFIHKDRQALAASDAVLTFWDESANKGSGTRAELTYSHDFGIPNYVVLDKGFKARELSIWLCGAIREPKYVFTDMAKALSAVIRDI